MYKSDIDTAFKNIGPTNAILPHSAHFYMKGGHVFISLRFPITRECYGRAGSCP